MQDFKDQRIYCAEQIFVPDNLPIIMKNYSKEVIRNQPKDILDFSLSYFQQQYENELKKEENSEKNEFRKPDENLIKNQSQQIINSYFIKLIMSNYELDYQKIQQPIICEDIY